MLKFLYMDERYIDALAPAEMQVTCLTGILVPWDTYARFRDRFLKLLPDIEKGRMREVHATNLFRDLPDSEHYAFYCGLVSLANDLGWKSYHRGFNYVPGHRLLRQAQSTMLWFCFRNLLISVAADEDSDVHIWPVMEIDHTKQQDRAFAGFVRTMDFATAHLDITGDGVEELIELNQMVDNSRFGEVHYVTKNSFIGSAVDCLCYLLHCKWLLDKGFKISTYKRRLAEIASSLSDVDVYIHEMRSNADPSEFLRRADESF